MLSAYAEEELFNGEKLSSLVTALENKEFRAPRLHAMQLIAQYAKRPQEYIPSYLDGPKDSDEIVRAASAQSLDVLGNRLPSLVGKFLPQLSARLEDPQQRVRAAAAHACFEIGSSASLALPDLRRRYGQDKSPLIRQIALATMAPSRKGPAITPICS